MKSIVPKIETLLGGAPAKAAVSPRAWPGDLWRIGVILIIALGTRLWVVRHTEVLSRDSIAFVRYALQIEEPPAGMTRLDVLRTNAHHPGYPVALLAVSWPIRSGMGGTTCDSMVASAQWTSILAALLLIVPLYFLGKMLFDRLTAFIAVLLVQVLPVMTQVTSDGLSDGLFLLMTATSIWFAAIGLRRDSTAWFAAAGLVAGLAYLVRPEGLIAVAAIGLVFAGLKLRGVWAWRPFAVRSTALTGGLLIAMLPYVTVIGGLTNKPTGKQLHHQEAHPSWERTSLEGPVGVNVPLAEWWNQEKGIFSSRALWGVKAVAVELGKTAFYVLPLLAFVGLFLARSRIRSDAATALLVVICALHLFLLWVVASRAGYVAERHTLLVVLLGSYFTAMAVVALGARLNRFPRLARHGSATLWTAIMVVVLVAASAPGGMKTLHANRAGHHAAGLWIAQHREPNDFVLDPFAWAEYYAGHIRIPPQGSTDVRVVFVVLEGMANNPHPRLHQMPAALQLAQVGTLVYHWPTSVTPEKAKVFVYRVEFPSNAPPLPQSELASLGEFDD